MFDQLPTCSHIPPQVGHTMRESLEAGKYYHVRLPKWASGGWNTHADSPAQAALNVGCAFKMWGFKDLPLVTEVLRHHRNSTIGFTYLEENCGEFPTSNADHYDI